MAVSDRLGGFVFPGYNPIEVPNPPTLNSAGVDPTASLAFTDPSDVGGGAITSYIALATNTSTGAVTTVTGASSPLAFSGLTVGASYAFTVVAVNAFGPSAVSNTITQTIIEQGQTAYTTAGTYTWVAPASVTSVSVVVVGGGGGSLFSSSMGGTGNYGGGGGGGALRYNNNYSVTPGSSYSVEVGAGGAGTSSNGDSGNGSNFVSSGTCSADGGEGGFNGTTANSTGQGGDSRVNGGSGGDGAGGGGGASFSGGGGVGLLGEGTSGSWDFSGGGGGSGGQVGYNYTPSGATTSALVANGGPYGGGGGCQDNNSGLPSTIGKGGDGAVRIIWPGNTRSFPSTNTGDL